MPVKSLVYTAPGQMELQDRPLPLPKADEVRIRVMANGICGSDVQGYLGKTGRRIPPMVMGHEFSGQIDAVGRSVEKWQPGDRVLAFPVKYCGHCPDCRSSLVQRCTGKEFLGAMQCDGSMQEFICMPQHLILAIPDTLTFEAAALTEPAAVAWQAVLQAGDLTGKKVLVIGAGTIGLLVLQAIRLRGADQVWVSDINLERLKTARLLGAYGLLDAGQQRPDSTFDVTFEAVGLSVTAAQAVNALRPGGLTVWIGNHQQMIQCDMQQIVTRELTIRGTYIYTEKTFALAADLIASGQIKTGLLISDRLPLTDGAAAFRMLADQPDKHLKVILRTD